MTQTVRVLLPILAPFLVAVGLLVSVAISPLTGIGPSNNTFFGFAALAIISGLAVGSVSLCLARSITALWRVIVGVLYVPTALFSALLAGF